MKTLVVTLATLLIAAGIGNAQTNLPFDVYVYGGMSVPENPGFFSTEYNEGFHFGAGVSRNLLPHVDGRFQVAYHRMTSGFGIADGGTIQLATFGLNARGYIPTGFMQTTLFAWAGGGIASLSQDDFQMILTEEEVFFIATDRLVIGSQTKGYFEAGVGVEYDAMPQVKIFAQGGFLQMLASRAGSVYDNDLRILTISAGVKLF